MTELNDLTLELQGYEEEVANSQFLRPRAELPVCYTIKNLSIKVNANVIFGDLDTKIGNILNKLPELETFFVTKLTTDLMKFITRSNLKIKTVKFKRVEEGTLVEYQQMRQTQPNIYREIQFINVILSIK